jgi:HNH endonuclease
MRGTPNVPENVWDKIDVRGPDECWLTTWTPSNPKPYFRLGGKKIRVTRLVYELVKGPIPDGLLVCHSCDVPKCSNPSHLWLGTCKENVRDCAAKGRQKRGIGMTHGMRKLDADQVKEVRAMRSTGRTLSEIGKIFGVSEATISLISRNLLWKSVQ